MEIYKNITIDNKYELVLKNAKNEMFKIHYGGADLYWSMSEYHDNNGFVITQEDGIFYLQLEKIFKLIEECDNPYDRLLNNNCFEWLSESYGQREDANKLLIKKENNSFHIKFIRNPNNFSPVDTCFISFCLSGSRNQEIANAFSTMFLEYRDYNPNNSNKKVLNKK